MRDVLRIVFHFLPVYPALTQRYFLLVAAVLFVALPYIKVKKLALLLERQEAGGDEVEIARTRAALKRMRYLIY